MMTRRQRFMAALGGEPLDRVPVFPLLMFLAADRAGLTYRQYATDGRALADAQLLVQERFDLDAVTVCSDAFRVPADLGGDMAYPEDQTPYLRQPLITAGIDLHKMGRPDPTAKGSRMADRVLAVSELARTVAGQVPVVGWVEMPFAEACSLCGLTEFMLLLVDNPARAHEVLTFAAAINVDLALAQLQAGADMIGAGDAAASLISKAMYAEFALPYEQQVCQAIHKVGGLVKLHVCGNTTHLLPQMATCEADLFNVDHLVPLDKARDAYAAQGKCYKGNLDPVSQLMQVSPERCQELAHGCLAQAKGTCYVLSAGCEIPAATPDEVLHALCNAPRTFASSNQL
jgi:MtaA/CmuA family methyltransferase